MAVTSVKLMSDSEASYSVKDDRRYTTVWRARCAAMADNSADVLASSLLPKAGDLYWGWRRQADGTYLANAVAKDPDAACVFVEPKRLEDDPRAWDVTFTYEGVRSPLAVPPEVDYEDVPYQEQQVQDVHGLLKTNSALDPYEEGTDVDRNRQRLVIVRPVPYDAWDPDFNEKFKNSLNLLPYAHGGLRRFVGTNTSVFPFVPVYAPIRTARGCAKLTSITARRMVRLQNPLPANAKYYWMVRAVIDFDYSLFTDNNGERQLRRWRRVMIDAGYNERVKGKLKRIMTANNGSASSGPQLLDGAGRRLFLAEADPTEASLPADQQRPVFDGTAPPLPPVPTVPSAGAGSPHADHVWYACRAGQRLTVPAPGVMANAANADATATATIGSADHGTLTPNSSGDGGFTYDPDPDYYGWALATFTITQVPYGASSPAKVCILCGPVPRVRVLEDYPHKDWTPLAAILGGW